MDPQERAMAYFRNMPTKQKKNPYWVYDRENDQIQSITGNTFTPMSVFAPLLDIREYFRRVYESFKTEAQVLCVSKDDGLKLRSYGFPTLESSGKWMDYPMEIFVLPQYNTPVNSIISDDLWQTYIAGRGITPIARVHSHHQLDAYQSSTDHSTLNSGTLELVMGQIHRDSVSVAFWLDQHGTNLKDHVWQMTKNETGNYGIRKIPCGALTTK